MSIKGRIERLERATGGNGDEGHCQCPGSGGMVWGGMVDYRVGLQEQAPPRESVPPFVDDGRPVPPVPENPCSKCGKPRQVIVVTWDDDPRGWEGV